MKNGLSDKTVKQLHDVARTLHMKGHWGLRKAELVRRIRSEHGKAGGRVVAAMARHRMRRKVDEELRSALVYQRELETALTACQKNQRNFQERISRWVRGNPEYQLRSGYDEDFRSRG